MKKTYKLGHLRGFTLIELLVVIAIIGILASVVLASLNSARDKGTNAAIKANISGVKAQAALYYDNASGVYEVDNTTDSVCVNTTASDPQGVADTIVATEALTPVGIAGCNDDPTSWAVASQLVGDDIGNYYCTDSTGFSGEIAGDVATDFDTDLVCQ
jgi:prepilin-type N-terminal cleavage/methylation domain-containing protein